MTMSLILLIVIFIIIIFCVRLYHKNTNGVCISKLRLDGKTALVTGGTTGMGLEIAKDFAQRGATVIIACPFKEEGENALKVIKEDSGNENIVFKLLDLGSLDSVRKIATDILNTEKRLDILVNNAGVGVPNYYITEDGINFTLQVNYFGHFLLNLLLLPLLKNSGKASEPSRIVNTSSIMHHIGRFDVKDLTKPCLPTTLSKLQQYGNSKFFFILYSRELTRRLKKASINVVINNVDPGNVGTRIFGARILGSAITYLYRFLFKTPREGAQTAIHVAVDKKAGEVSGEFFKDCILTKAKSLSYNDVLASKLWNESVSLVKLSDKEVEYCFQ